MLRPIIIWPYLIITNWTRMIPLLEIYKNRLTLYQKKKASTKYMNWNIQNFWIIWKTKDLPRYSTIYSLAQCWDIMDHHLFWQTCFGKDWEQIKTVQVLYLIIFLSLKILMLIFTNLEVLTQTKRIFKNNCMQSEKSSFKIRKMLM